MLDLESALKEIELRYKVSKNYEEAKLSSQIIATVEVLFDKIGTLEKRIEDLESKAYHKES